MCGVRCTGTLALVAGPEGLMYACVLLLQAWRWPAQLERVLLLENRLTTLGVPVPCTSVFALQRLRLCRLSSREPQLDNGMSQMVD